MWRKGGLKSSNGKGFGSTPTMIEVDKLEGGFPIVILQTLAHIIYPWSPFIGIGGFIFLLRFPSLLPFLAAYAIYIYLDKGHERGSRSSAWLRNIPFWKWYTGYFPATLIKEAELSPDHNYIFGYHPHGIIALGGFANFASNGTGFSELFPGIQVNMLTLNMNFLIPFYRDFILFMGMASVSKDSINYILNRGTGNACLISIGGSAESLLAGPNNSDLVLAKRYGFVKIAIQNGAHLVPVYNFGENSLAYQYSPKPGSLLYKFQHFLKKLTGMTLPFFYARGWMPNTRGVVPFDVPMVTIIGKPIPVTKNSNPSSEEILNVHAKYVAALKDLYNRNAAEYHPRRFGPHPELRLVDA